MRAMKDSGIEWVGEIPEDWEIARLKDIAANETYSIVDGPFGTAISTSDYQDTGVPLVRIVNLNQTELRTDNFVYITDEHAEKVARSRFYKDDIIFAKTGATVGKCAYNSNVESGILSSSCVKIRISDRFYRKFYYYFFNTNQFNEALRMACNGTTRDTINLKPFSCLNCLLPSLKEQQAISAYLDRQCGLIDSVIEKTKASIEEYKKLRQAVITQAVTKGVRGDRPMKDSGIEWIGEIPEEWQILKSWYTMDTLGDIDHFMPESTDNGKPYLMIGDLKDNSSEIIFDKCKKISDEDFDNLSVKFKPMNGDVIFARYATIGTVCYVDTDNDFLVSYACVTIRPNQKNMTGKFMYYYFKSSIFIEDIRKFINSNTQENVGKDSLTKFHMIVPSIYEQKEIAEYLDKKCTEIDTLITKKEQFLTELESYKKSMIYEYVTGKKEVPQA